MLCYSLYLFAVIPDFDFCCAVCIRFKKLAVIEPTVEGTHFFQAIIVNSNHLSVQLVLNSMTKSNKLTGQDINPETIRQHRLCIDFTLIPLKFLVHGPSLKAASRWIRTHLIVGSRQKLYEVLSLVDKVGLFWHVLSNHLI
jgi:hypothetical protein